MALGLRYGWLPVALGLALMLALAPVTGPAGEALAQSRKTVRELQQQVASIQAEMDEIRSLIAEQQKNALSEDSRTALLADMEVRIGRLDTQVRELTGQVEEVIYSQDQLQDAFESFKADMEFRFQEMEAGSGPLSGGAGTGSNFAGVTETGTGPQETAIESPSGEGATFEATALAEPGRQPGLLPEGTPAERYDYAFGYLMRGDYPGAEQAFLVFLDEYPDHQLAGNAQYWLGETYYVRKDFPRALQAFFDGYQKYGDGNKGVDSLLKLGLTLASMNQIEEACAAFQQLEIRYPDAPQNILDLAASEISRFECS